MAAINAHTSFLGCMLTLCRVRLPMSAIYPALLRADIQNKQNITNFFENCDRNIVFLAERPCDGPIHNFIVHIFIQYLYIVFNFTREILTFMKNRFVNHFPPTTPHCVLWAAVWRSWSSWCPVKLQQQSTWVRQRPAWQWASVMRCVSLFY